MALRIKLTRIGRRNDPKYRIIVAEARSKRDGSYIDLIGRYDPLPTTHILEQKLREWLGKGAQLTKGTARLLRHHLK